MYVGVPSVSPVLVTATISAGAFDGARDPEVGDERASGGAFDQDVLGLDVAVHDVLAVRVLERFGDVARDATVRGRWRAGRRRRRSARSVSPSMKGIV